MRVVTNSLRIFFIGLALLVSACTNNTPKHKVYAGKGATQTDLKKLNTFLEQRNFYNTAEERKVELSKQDTTYIVRWAVDTSVLAQNSRQILFEARVWQKWISEKVFPGAKVILTDADFNDQVPAGAFTQQEADFLYRGQLPATDTTTNDSTATIADSTLRQ